MALCFLLYWVSGPSLPALSPWSALLVFNLCMAGAKLSAPAQCRWQLFGGLVGPPHCPGPWSESSGSYAAPFPALAGSLADTGWECRLLDCQPATALIDCFPCWEKHRGRCASLLPKQISTWETERRSPFMVATSVIILQSSCHLLGELAGSPSKQSTVLQADEIGDYLDLFSLLSIYRREEMAFGGLDKTQNQQIKLNFTSNYNWKIIDVSIA